MSLEGGLLSAVACRSRAIACRSRAVACTGPGLLHAGPGLLHADSGLLHVPRQTLMCLHSDHRHQCLVHHDEHNNNNRHKWMGMIPPFCPQDAIPCPPPAPQQKQIYLQLTEEVCRYLATHGYNISMVHLVDQIASPYPKKLFEARTSAALDEWPTPTEYYYNIREGNLTTQNLLLQQQCCAITKYVYHVTLF